MTQDEAVIEAMQANGGYATLGYLYQTAPKVPGSHWGTKTPFASIRRIVQNNPAFFKIRPGLWALMSERKAVLEKLATPENAPPQKVEAFNHTYYQGLLVEIGNLKGFQTFVPDQDKNRLYLSKKLADVATLSAFPAFTYDGVLSHGRTVDVAWFNSRRFPSFFYEVEHSTDFYNSLRKYVEFQDFCVQFRIVADTLRKPEFDQKIKATAYDAIRESVRFVDYETVSQWHSKAAELAAIEKPLSL